MTNIGYGFIAFASILMLAIVATPTTAHTHDLKRQLFAQAGSAGGTIGKRGKSAAGSDNRSSSISQKKKPNIRTRQKATAAAPASRGITGRWSWQAKCPSSYYQGEFEVGAVTNGQFTGQFHSDVPGRIVRGSLNGDSVSFTRIVMGFPQPWRGTLSGGAMSGSIYGVAGAVCTFTATR